MDGGIVDSYRELVVWQKSMALAETVYRCSPLLPKKETRLVDSG